MNTARLLGIAAVCVLAGASAAARDLTTIRGAVYKNITVTNQDATGLEISHEDGVIYLDYRLLSKADQAEFGFDPTAYAAGLKQKAEADKLRREQALAAQQAAAARAKAQADDANSWKTYSATGPLPPYVPTNQTSVQYSVDTPGFTYGGYNYGGGFYSNPPLYRGTYPPSLRSPYYYYGPGFNGPTWGPQIIRKR